MIDNDTLDVILLKLEDRTKALELDLISLSGAHMAPIDEARIISFQAGYVQAILDTEEILNVYNG